LLLPGFGLVSAMAMAMSTSAARATLQTAGSPFRRHGVYGALDASTPYL
jgi:hypothetical protein